MEIDDVRRVAGALPRVEERLSWGRPAWFVTRLLARSWDEQRLTVRVEDDSERLALTEQRPAVFSTTDHHAGSALVLVSLAAVGADDLQGLLREAWWWAASPTLRTRHPELAPPADTIPD